MMPRQSYRSDVDHGVLVRGKFGTRMGFGVGGATTRSCRRKRFLRRGPGCSHKALDGGMTAP